VSSVLSRLRSIVAADLASDGDRGALRRHVRPDLDAGGESRVSTRRRR